MCKCCVVHQYAIFIMTGSGSRASSSGTATNADSPKRKKIVHVTLTMSANTPKNSYSKKTICKELFSYTKQLTERIGPEHAVEPQDFSCKEGTSRNKLCFFVTMKTSAPLLPFFSTDSLRRAITKGVIFSERDIDSVESDSPVSSPHPKGAATQKKEAAKPTLVPTFTCVLRSVPTAIADQDLLKELKKEHPKTTGAKRIVARANNQPTRLVRVFSPCQETITTILRVGATINGNPYDAEPSNPPPLVRMRCSHCFSFEHLRAQCPKKSEPATCPTCSSAIHPGQPCKTENAACPSCQGHHGVWKCPKALEIPPGAPRKIFRLPEEGPKATNHIEASSDISAATPPPQKLPVTVHQLLSALVLIADMDPTAPRKVRLQTLSHWSRQNLNIDATFLFQGNVLAGIHYNSAETDSTQRPRAAHRSRSKERRRSRGTPTQASSDAKNHS